MVYIAEKSMGQVGDAVQKAKNALNMLGFAFSAVGLEEFVRRSLDAGDQMFILSQRTGIAVQNLAGLELAAKMNGTSLDGVAMGVGRHFFRQ